MARCADLRPAAEIVENGLVRGEDTADLSGVRRGVPDVTLKGAAKDDPVGTGEHIAPFARRRVPHLRLRREDRELTADGDHLLVTEEGAGADTGAVENERLGQG